uniref:Uncharacterized protein n=1 Tax=Lepeophtheirus salmonis TaxID=72036 RepID=A0A0K2TJM1_LEPSM
MLQKYMLSHNPDVGISYQDPLSLSKAIKNKKCAWDKDGGGKIQIMILDLAHTHVRKKKAAEILEALD